MSDRCHPENELWFLGTVPRESRDRSWCVTVLSGGDVERNWSQRYKPNLEKLASGDLVQVVEVVCDLAGREAGRGLSAGEKRMLARARLILLQEG
jgi:CarD family transcriptional regulator